MWSEKQLFELKAVSLLQEASGSLQDFELLPGADPPDVCASRRGEIIGVEVRKVFQDEAQKGGSWEKKYRQACRNVVNYAQAYHRTIEKQWYVVGVYFVADMPGFDRRRARVIAKLLVDQVRNTEIKQGEIKQFRSEDLWGPEWPEEVLGMIASVFSGGEGPDWTSGFNAWVRQTDKNLIQDALDKKESRWAAFPNDIHNRWLLLVCDGSVGSSLLELHKAMPSDNYRSSYNRVFVLDFTGKKYIELSLTKTP